jgi:hypothetical protein
MLRNTSSSCLIHLHNHFFGTNKLRGQEEGARTYTQISGRGEPMNIPALIT